MANVTNKQISEQLANLPEALAAALVKAQRETSGRFTTHRPADNGLAQGTPDGRYTIHRPVDQDMVLSPTKLGQPSLAKIIARKYKAIPGEGQYINAYGQACVSTLTGSTHENKIYRHRNKLCWCNRGSPGRCHAVTRYGEDMTTWGIETQ